jgi:hypothetical protein
VKKMQFTEKEIRLIAAEADVDERTVRAWADGTREPWGKNLEKIETAAKKVTGGR